MEPKRGFNPATAGRKSQSFFVPSDDVRAGFVKEVI